MTSKEINSSGRTSLGTDPRDWTDTPISKAKRDLEEDDAIHEKISEESNIDPNLVSSSKI